MVFIALRENEDMIMQPRKHIPVKIRGIYSKLHKLINQKFIKGSIYELRNTCGKKNCKCTKGEKHLSLYIQQTTKGKKKKTLISKPDWDEVRQMSKRYKEIQDCLEAISVYEWENIKKKKQK